MFKVNDLEDAVTFKQAPEELGIGNVCESPKKKRKKKKTKKHLVLILS